MIAYVPACKETMSIEAQGNDLFQELVISRLPGHRFIQHTDETEYGRFLQLTGVDYTVVTPGSWPGCLVEVELKTESNSRWNNLFLEMFQSVERLQKGWLQTCSSKLLCYSFLRPEPVIYVMQMNELRELILETPLFCIYPCKTQKARSLPSTAAGFCVPVCDLRDSLRHFYEIREKTPTDVIQRAFSMAIHE